MLNKLQEQKRLMQIQLQQNESVMKEKSDKIAE